MTKKIWLFAFTLLVMVTMSIPIIPVVAQELASTPTEPVGPAPEVTFGWVFAGWLVYAIAGLLANKDPFDPVKFGRSFLITVFTGFVAIAFKISPVNVETQFGGLLGSIANLVVNTAPGVTLIYLVDKTWKFIFNLKVKIEAARAATGPGPPK